jgi:hypothetical protein
MSFDFDAHSTDQDQDKLLTKKTGLWRCGGFHAQAPRLKTQCYGGVYGGMKAVPQVKLNLIGYFKIVILFQKNYALQFCVD